MTQEDKQLLLKDLSARLPYGVKVKYIFDDGSHCPFELSTKILQECLDKGFLPYLRPMSSMTEEEKREFQSFYPGCFGNQWLDVEEGEIEIFECSSTITLYLNDNVEIIDWLNAHHFDYRGLIEQELALEVPKGMYE